MSPAGDKLSLLLPVRMRALPFYRFLFIISLILLLPFTAAQAADDLPIPSPVAVTDSVPARKPAAKPEEANQPDIKEVPKSKKQAKPLPVGENIKIKVKPPVRIKPMIKRPGIIKKTLGIIR